MGLKKDYGSRGQPTTNPCPPKNMDFFPKEGFDGGGGAQWAPPPPPAHPKKTKSVKYYLTSAHMQSLYENYHLQEETPFFYLADFPAVFF